ncbi:granzyme B-like [Polyodon spathula]|uniref:granzyme B-like n=1 Tax=Polyodon spathula TaxID=7913 RepID=UPI001B7D95AA|nr:granzyme B-like [Polyodon spathula]
MPAKPHSRRYMASLQIDRQYVCGGFLVREDFVLTAAHYYKDRALAVVLGAHNLTAMEKSQQKIEVKEFYKHKLISLNKYDFDVMLPKVFIDSFAWHLPFKQYVRLVYLFRLPGFCGKIHTFPINFVKIQMSKCFFSPQYSS